MTTRGARNTSDLVPLEAIQHNILVLRGCTGAEKAELVANCDHLLQLKFSPNLPLRDLLATVRRLIEPPPKQKQPIGFHIRDRRALYRSNPRHR